MIEQLGLRYPNPATVSQSVPDMSLLAFSAKDRALFNSWEIWNFCTLATVSSTNTKDHTL